MLFKLHIRTAILMFVQARLLASPHLANHADPTNQSLFVEEDGPAENIAPAALEGNDEGVLETVELPTESREESTLLADRQTLSARIQTIVEDAVADLRIMMTDLEERQLIQDHERHRWEAELEELLFARMETLAQRDAESSDPTS